MRNENLAEVLFEEGLGSRPCVSSRIRPKHRWIRVSEERMRRTGIGLDLSGFVVLLQRRR